MLKTLDELGALWQAAGRLPHPATADLVLFMLSTPCRRGEAACARWRDFFKARIWHQPVTKNGDEHRYPLNDLALGILRRRLSDGIQPGDLVFPGPRRAQVFGGWSNLADALADRLGDDMPDWRLHDFRRAFATHLAERGHDEILLDLTINHRGSRSQGGGQRCLPAAPNDGMSVLRPSGIGARSSAASWPSKALSEAWHERFLDGRRRPHTH